MNSIFFKSLGALFCLILMGCSVLATRPDREVSQSERFKAFKKEKAPLNKPLKIYWDKHSIPFIEAETDQDLAFGIGVVHAHLRLGQLEILRHISQGRLSEIAGPLESLKKVDGFLRAINFKGAAENSKDKISPEAWAWTVSFTEGINWYIEQMEQKPVDLEILDIDPTPFQPQDIITIGKLIGLDLSWAIYLKFLKIKEKPDWEKFYEQEISSQTEATFTHQSESTERITDLLKNFTKSGSNSLVVSGQRSKNKSAMIASDPHVGLFLPNFWLLMGIKSPNYHAVGLMIPGTPFIGVGRNRHIAWGGTNMRGISSHLYRIPKDRNQVPVTLRQEVLKRRWWNSTKIEIQETNYGPLISDSNFFDQKNKKEDIALNWIGRHGSDELTPFLNVAKAKNWSQFRGAFAPYQIPAMNMLYADDKGHIGMVPAYGQPVLKDPSKTLALIKDIDNPIVGILKPTEQENPYDPAVGYIASANNKPFSKPAIPYGYVFADSQRIDRLKTLMQTKDPVDVNFLKTLQMDVFSKKAFDFKELLKAKVPQLQEKKTNSIYQKLLAWNGEFRAESDGAPVFELIQYQAWQDYLEDFLGSPSEKEYLEGKSDPLPILTQWIAKQKTQELSERLSNWIMKLKNQIQKTPLWGNLHIQAQASPYGLLPLIGSRYQRPSYPASGSNDTLYKSGRKLSSQQENVTYGSSARHISDLSSLDENYFVLHGGQDGWLFNDQIDDQTALWRKGEYIKIPLSLDKVKGQFTNFVLTLRP